MAAIVEHATAPAGWLEALDVSLAEVARGESMPMFEVLDELRAMTERREAELGLSPDGEALPIKR